MLVSLFLIKLIVKDMIFYKSMDIIIVKILLFLILFRIIFFLYGYVGWGIYLYELRIIKLVECDIGIWLSVEIVYINFYGIKVFYLSI